MGNPDWQKAKNKAQKQLRIWPMSLSLCMPKTSSTKGTPLVRILLAKRLRMISLMLKQRISCWCGRDQGGYGIGNPDGLPLCGDVGYGKTGGSLTGGVQNVMEGKTSGDAGSDNDFGTAALQYSFREVSEISYQCEVISRFQNLWTAKEILEIWRLASWTWLSAHTACYPRMFILKDLGLLIIDEERFGVRSKEK